MSWAQIADETIRKTLAGLPKDITPEEKRKAVEAAYPFGERAMHPYKIWRKRVQFHLGPSERKRAADRKKLQEMGLLPQSQEGLP